MGKKLAFMAFWAINDELDVEKACSQLLEMKRLGLTGVVFHPRNYPGVPKYLGREYMERLSGIILAAKKNGMDFWLYDENGYPSGTASGKVLLKNPDAKCMWLEYHDGSVTVREKNAVSTLDAKVCRDFVEITFDGYKQGLSDEAFAHVAGVFSDEVGFLDGSNVSLKYGGVPWCMDMEERYRAAYGEELGEKLPLLFEEGEGCELVRERYWELLSKILRENFYAPIHRWCEENGKRYTAHLKGEENIFFNLSYDGSPYEILQEISVPAVDALERYPGNHYYPHIAGSIARQFYDGSCLCEAMGGSGWGAAPKDFVAYMKWLVECGVNMFVFHLSQYTLKAQAIRDWPPSTPLHISWREAFPEALFRITEYQRLVEERERGKERVLIVTPTRGCMRRFVPADAACINEHNGAGVPDTEAGRISNAYGALIERCHEKGILYDVTEEKLLETHGRIERAGVQLGNVRYCRVLLGEGCCFHDKKLRERLRAYGLEVSETELLQEKQEEAARRREAGPSPAQEERTAGRAQESDGVLKKAGADNTEWEISAEGENQILLELAKEEAGVRRCRIPLVHMEAAGELYLESSDPVKQICVNGQILEAATDRQNGYVIPAKLLEKESLCMEVRLLEEGEQDPFVFLKGSFLVKSETGYQEKDGRQLYTRGNFFLTAKNAAVCADRLVESGFPFQKQPVVLRKRVMLPEGAEYLKLTGFFAAAARVRLDDNAPVWVFGENELVELPRESGRRSCLICAELYPSTYNMYGPHHHRDGDRHLVSPDQYSGKKNFADFNDSPERTLVDGWHFVKFGLGKEILFYGDRKNGSL